VARHRLRVDVTDIYTPAFFAEHHQTVTLSASVIAPIVMEQLAPHSALDLGCGWGEWLDALGIEDVVGVDIASEREGVIQHDLTTPLDLGRFFDLVISLETEEHLPEEAADTYVASIARHGNTVLFSAAVPGQEGLHHVNCQVHDYWHEKFEQLGFEVTDPIRPLIANDWRVSPWYRSNTFVYLSR
jgi:cyclopropane fatty-acyl-phospholipid synthase-like methyltransferase